MGQLVSRNSKTKYPRRTPAVPGNPGTPRAMAVAPGAPPCRGRTPAGRENRRVCLQSRKSSSRDEYSPNLAKDMAFTAVGQAGKMASDAVDKANDAAAERLGLKGGKSTYFRFDWSSDIAMVNLRAVRRWDCHLSDCRRPPPPALLGFQWFCDLARVVVWRPSALTHNHVLLLGRCALAILRLSHCRLAHLGFAVISSFVLSTGRTAVRHRSAAHLAASSFRRCYC